MFSWINHGDTYIFKALTNSVLLYYLVFDVAQCPKMKSKTVVKRKSCQSIKPFYFMAADFKFKQKRKPFLLVFSGIVHSKSFVTDYNHVFCLHLVLSNFSNKQEKYLSRRQVKMFQKYLLSIQSTIGSKCHFMTIYSAAFIYISLKLCWF